MSGWKDWEIGEVVTEGEFQSFVQDQVVQRYADSAARTSALGTAVAEGMVSYLDDSNAVQIYNGTAWVPIGEGDITAVTAGTGLSGGGTAGDVTLSADYAAIGSAITIETSQISDITATAAELNILDGATVTAAALNTIDDGTAGFTALSNGTAGISYQPVSHNYIINGAFDVWQRGTSGFTTNGAFTADRYEILVTGETVAVSQQAFTPADLTAVGFGESSFFSRYEVTTSANAANNALYRTKIEDLRNLAGQTVTFSYFAKADSAKSVAIELTQNFGSGGSGAVNTFVAKQAITSSWARYSHTVTVPSISGKTVGTGSFIDLRFWLSAGSNFNARTDSLGQQSITFDTFGWQLEAGSVATPFKRNAPSLQGEEAACQRYYQKIAGDAFGSSFATGYIATTTSARVFVPIPTTMRTSPTMAVSGTATISFDGTALTPSAYSNILQYGNAIKVHAAVTGAVGNHACSWNFANGVIEFSAEL